MKAIAIVLLLVGCATTERLWEKPGAGQRDYSVDSGQCQAQAYGSSPGMVPLQIAVIFNGCMRGKGWDLVERPIRR